MARQVLENGVILPAEYSDDWYDDMTSNLTKLDDVIGSDSEKLSSADVGAAALSNNYNDLDNLPTIPTVNDATLTIQKNGVDVQTFTANASSNVTCNITVPTKTSDLTNDSNFVDTSNSAVASGITSAKVTSYDSHVADTDIHVTTADKNKWNNQTYVFRYSSTALVASSTNSNTLLDNTDNLKVGDKVIDSNGVLFSITAIDTANSTFTIGTALVDLALDGNVVHTSGNETVGGVKTFSNNTYITSLNFTNEVESQSSSSSAVFPIVTTVTYTDSSPSQSARLNFRITANGDKSLYPHENNQYALGLTSCKWSEVHGVTYYYGSSDTEFSQKFVTTDTAQSISGFKTIVGSYLTNEFSSNARTCVQYVSNVDDSSKSGIFLSKFAQGSSGVITRTQIGYDVYSNSVRTNRAFYLDFGSFVNDAPTKLEILSLLTTKNLGSIANKFTSVNTTKINELEPSALGLPDLSNGVDISSYLDTSQSSANTYTPAVNGWVSIKGRSSQNCGVVIMQGDFAQSSYNLIDFGSSDKVTFCALPVKAGVQVEIWLKSITTLDSAKFFPCQGNV